MPDTVERDARETAGAVRIAGLDHVVLRVASLDRAIEFYGKVLGCRSSANCSSRGSSSCAPAPR